MQRCIYRFNQPAPKSESDSSVPFSRTSPENAQCDVLQEKGVLDITCYNLELSERTCSISPICTLKTGAKEVAP